MYVCVCLLFIYIINIHSTHTYIYAQKLLLWMQLITINRCPALVLSFFVKIKPNWVSLYLKHVSVSGVKEINLFQRQKQDYISFYIGKYLIVVTWFE